MGMAWYKFYSYIFLPLGILGYILGLNDVSFHFFYFYLGATPYPSYVPRYIFVIIAAGTIVLNLILIFGLHYKKLWAWYLNIFSLALFIIAASIHNFANIQTFVCGVLLNGALWFIPNYSYFKRRKIMFT